MISIIRLAFSLLLLFVSFFTVIKPPTNELWKLSIVAMEWGHYLAILAVILIVVPGREMPAKIGIGISFISTFLFIYPMLTALKIQSQVKSDVHRLFPASSREEKNMQELNIANVFAGIHYKHQTYSTYAFKNGLTLDFYPSVQKEAPLVLVIHGGGWDSGDSQQLPELNEFLAFKGYNVASINYRLAPAYRYNDQIGDVKEALAFLKNSKEQLKFDTSRIVLLGRSAGGQLALQAAYTWQDKDIKGVISFYAPADMVWGYSVPGNPRILDSRRVLCNYIGGGCDVMKEKYVEASPMESVTADAPPTLLLHGRPDVMVAFEHSIRLNEKLNKTKVLHYLVDLPWATHGYDYNFNGPGSQISVYAIEHFLHYVTKKTAIQ